MRRETSRGPTQRWAQTAVKPQTAFKLELIDLDSCRHTCISFLILSFFFCISLSLSLSDRPTLQITGTTSGWLASRRAQRQSWARTQLTWGSSKSRWGSSFWIECWPGALAAQSSLLRNMEYLESHESIFFFLITITCWIIEKSLNKCF